MEGLCTKLAFVVPTWPLPYMMIILIKYYIIKVVLTLLYHIL